MKFKTPSFNLIVENINRHFHNADSCVFFNFNYREQKYHTSGLKTEGFRMFHYVYVNMRTLKNEPVVKLSNFH